MTRYRQPVTEEADLIEHMEKELESLLLREIKETVVHISQNNKSQVNMNFPTAALDAKA